MLKAGLRLGFRPENLAELIEANFFADVKLNEHENRALEGAWGKSLRLGARDRLGLSYGRDGADFGAHDFRAHCFGAHGADHLAFTCCSNRKEPPEDGLTVQYYYCPRIGAG